MKNITIRKTPTSGVTDLGQRLSCKEEFFISIDVMTCTHTHLA